MFPGQEHPRFYSTESRNTLFFFKKKEYHLLNYIVGKETMSVLTVCAFVLFDFEVK